MYELNLSTELRLSRLNFAVLNIDKLARYRMSRWLE